MQHHKSFWAVEKSITVVAKIKSSNWACPPLIVNVNNVRKDGILTKFFYF